MEKENEVQTQDLLLQEVRKQSLFLKITSIASCGIFVVLFIIAIVLVPKLYILTQKADETITKANETITVLNNLAVTAQDSLDDITTATNNANDLIVANAENLTEVIEKLNNVDFDTLNSSIQGLHDAIEPFKTVVNLISAFGGNK